MNSFLQDLRYAVRMLWGSPGMTAAVVLTLALGIGANTAVFSLVQATLLNPVPGVARSGELVELFVADSARGTQFLSSPEYRDFLERNDVFAGFLAFGHFPMNLTDGETTERIWPLLVSGNYFEVLGVRASHGRTFLPKEDAAGGQQVVVISHALWQRHFGGTADVIGKTITLNRHTFTIIGITPPGFYGTIPGLAFDAWLPLEQQDLFSNWRRSESRGFRWLFGVGRLKPGVSASLALSRLNLIAKDLARNYPESNKNLGVALYPLGRSPFTVSALLGSLLTILMGLVGVLLLMACANVANLLLSRAATRRREIVIRMAIGASRARVVRQLLTESLILALLGGVAGVLAGLWTAASLPRLFPPTDLPIHYEQNMDPAIFLFSLFLTGATGVVFGLIPALRTTRSDLVATLKDDAAGTSGGLSRSRLRTVLMVTQIALSLVLLVPAGLFLRSLLNAQKVDTGFNPRNVLMGSLFLEPESYDAVRGERFYQQLIDQVQALPGVRVAALVRWPPLGLGDTPSSDIVVEGYAPRANERVWSRTNRVAPGFFRALEVPFLAGRDFTWQDNDASPRVVVINQALAARYWPNRDPIGQRIQFENTWLTIIGVVRDFKTLRLDESPTPFLFLPATQFYHPALNLLVRTAGDPAMVAPAVQRAVHELDEQLPLYAVRTLEQSISAASFPQRLAASLLGAFGVLALALAAVGIYGVMAYGVAQRVREFGIRMALGAQRGDILRLILVQGAKLILIGTILGISGAFAVARLLGPFLLAVSPHDALTFAGVTALLSLVALIGCYIPARRATRVDPVVALRHE